MIVLGDEGLDTDRSVQVELRLTAEAITLSQLPSQDTTVYEVLKNFKVLRVLCLVALSPSPSPPKDFPSHCRSLLEIFQQQPKTLYDIHIIIGQSS